jgi:hypothetical protein
MERDESDDRLRRWQRRQRRQIAARERMQKHGAAVRRVYPAAIRKRLAASRSKPA